MIVSGYGKAGEIRSLFAEYTEMLLAIDPSFQVYLDIQGYDAELDEPELKYALSDGRLYIDEEEGKAAGCIALRKLSDSACELKRLYVRPEFRRKGIAAALVSRILSEARSIGYKEIYLDTLPELEGAIRLYRQFGFENTVKYNDSPSERTVFMKLCLQ